MPSFVLSADLATIFQHFASICQVTTALIASAIGIITYRYTKRQSQLALVNQHNSLAHVINRAVTDSEQARTALGKVQDFIVGCPDDAVILMYLNFVHNTYRMNRMGVVSGQVWRDTLENCLSMVERLRRDQVVQFLSRGFERGFQSVVLARYDTVAVRTLGEAAATVRRECSFPCGMVPA